MSRTIVVGLDGLSPMLLDLPEAENMAAKYAENGGRLRSTFPPTTGPAWSSFQTGKNPENHGVTSLIKIEERDGEYATSQYSSVDLEGETLYEAMVAEGEDCFLMNLPYTHPPRIEGDVITSWLTKSDDPDEFVHPTDLPQRYPSVRNYRAHPEGNSDTAFLQSLLGIERQRTAIAREVVEANDHEFVFFLFSGTDTIQHRAFEDLQDRIDSRRGDLAREILAEIDDFVGWLLDSSNDEDDIVFMSDHGFRHYEGFFSINGWLAENGYLVHSGDGVTFQESADNTTIDVGFLYDFVRGNRFLSNLAMPVYRWLDASGIELVSSKGIDLSESVGYCRHDQEQSIHLTVTGGEYETTKARLLGELREIEGIDAVDVAAEYGSADRLGDVVVTSDRYQVIRGDGNPPVLERPIPYHHVNGIVMLDGPAFGSVPRGMTIEDLMPTILYANDHAIPSDLDGEVIRECTTKEYDPTYRDPRAGNRPSEAVPDSAATEERLEDLGYL